MGGYFKKRPPENAVVVAVSGGMDALAVLNILKSQDKKLYGVIIDGGYPDYATEQAIKMAKKYCYNYEVVKIGRSEGNFIKQMRTPAVKGMPYTAAITMLISSMVADMLGIQEVASGVKNDVISDFSTIDNLSIIDNLKDYSKVTQPKKFIFPLRDYDGKDDKKIFDLLLEFGISKEEIFESIVCLNSQSGCGECRHCNKLANLKGDK